MILPVKSNYKFVSLPEVGSDTTISFETKSLLAKGAFHSPELTCETIPVAMIISLLIKTLQPDQSNPDTKEKVFQDKLLEKRPISFSN